jgi:hypothetical protein
MNHNEDDNKVNVHYSTFWNDFSHYSIYNKKNTGITNETNSFITPIDYSDISK